MFNFFDLLGLGSRTSNARRDDDEISTTSEVKTPPKVLIDPRDLSKPEPTQIKAPEASEDGASVRRSWEMSGRGGEGGGEVTVRRESMFSSSWSSKTAFEAITGEPASTRTAADKGISAPQGPKLFLGAQVRLTDGKVAISGTLVGYDSSGRAIVRQPGKPEINAPRGAEIALLPNQEWKSALESLPSRNLVRPSASDLVALRKLTDERAGSGDKVRDYVKAIRDAGFEAFVSGGAIRDILTGVTPRDVDLCTTMWCEDVSDAARKGRLSTGRSLTNFGTLLISNLDVTSLKRARGEFGFDLNEDAKYRDFTVNALYFDPASGIIGDPFGTGVADAKAKILRPCCAPGGEQAWIRNNSSAVLRIFKFTLKGYKPTPELLKVLKENFKWAMSDMDGLRKSRTMDSIRASRSELTAEMKRLGFDKEVDLVFPSYRSSRDDDDGPGFGRFTPSWRSTSRDDDEEKSTPTRTGQVTANGGSWIQTGPGRSRYVAGGASTDQADKKDETPPIQTNTFSSPRSRLEDYAKANGLTVGRPDSSSASLAIARGHLGFVASKEEDATSTLTRAGFTKSSPGLWEADDNSWVRFDAGNVYRGHEKTIYSEIPYGTGPRS